MLLINVRNPYTGSSKTLSQFTFSDLRAITFDLSDLDRWGSSHSDFEPLYRVKEQS